MFSLFRTFVSQARWWRRRPNACNHTTRPSLTSSAPSSPQQQITVRTSESGSPRVVMQAAACSVSSSIILVSHPLRYLCKPPRRAKTVALLPTWWSRSSSSSSTGRHAVRPAALACGPCVQRYPPSRRGYKLFSHSKGAPRAHSYVLASWLSGTAGHTR